MTFRELVNGGLEAHERCAQPNPPNGLTLEQLATELYYSDRTQADAQETGTIFA